jgi:hypothetical protein
VQERFNNIEKRFDEEKKSAEKQFDSLQDSISKINNQLELVLTANGQKYSN